MTMLEVIKKLTDIRADIYSGPMSKERSWVITKLDEAILWARECSVNNPEQKEGNERTVRSPLGPSDSGRYA